MSVHIYFERESKHTLKHAVRNELHPMSTNDAKNSCEQIVPHKVVYNCPIELISYFRWTTFQEQYSIRHD